MKKWDNIYQERETTKTKGLEKLTTVDLEEVGQHISRRRNNNNNKRLEKLTNNVDLEEEGQHIYHERETTKTKGLETYKC